MPDNSTVSETKPSTLTAQRVLMLYDELRSHYAERNSRYNRSRELYRGEHWGGEDLPRPDGDERYTITVNYIRPTVDKTVQMLFGSLPGIQVFPPGSEPDARDMAEAAEGVLYHTWSLNAAEKTFRRLAHNMSLLDLGVLYFWWDSNREVVRFKSIAPDNFYPLYDGDEIVECILVSKRLTRRLRRNYPALADKITSDQTTDSSQKYGNSQTFTDLLSPERFDGDHVHIPSGPSSDESGYTTVVDWYDDAGNWVRIMGDAVHRQNLGYQIDRVPVILFPNAPSGDDTEASSEIRDISDLNLYLDSLISQNADIIRRYSYPTVVDKQSGQSPQDIRQTIQRVGGVIPVKKEGDISYLNWTGTPPDIQNQYLRVLNSLYDIGGKPASSYGQLLSNQSGTASNMAMSPVSASTEVKQGMVGFGLQTLNRSILQLLERFMKGKEIEVKVSARSRPGTSAWRQYTKNLNGDQIDGWYENRIKWPSVLRTDDPVYVQNELAKMRADGSNPPAQSQYTTMENLGTEDVEHERELIQSELQDPALHPERLTASVGAATQMQQGMMGPGMGGLDPASAGSAPIGDPELDAALSATGNPNASKSTKEPKAKGY